VIRDIISVFRRRAPQVALTLIPTAVQGREATAQIVRALQLADRADFDAIILARGGGSLEDLWCFNEEAVARAVADCTTPIVSAVGHETDVSISDFVADVREHGVRQPIFITVDPDGTTLLSEGNHRRDAAVEAGQPVIPVNIRYFGQAEKHHLVAPGVHRTIERPAPAGRDGTVVAKKAAFEYDDSVIRRGLCWALPDTDRGWDLAQKFASHTITVEEIVRGIGGLGVWWGLESQYGGMSEYESHAEANFGVPVLQALREAKEEAEAEGSTPRDRWFGGDVALVFTAKRPTVGGKPWDPATMNPPEMGGLMGNSYLPDHQSLEITEVRYDVGDGYHTLKANGIRATAVMDLGRSAMEY